MDEELGARFLPLYAALLASRRAGSAPLEVVVNDLDSTRRERQEGLLNWMWRQPPASLTLETWNISV